MWNRGFRGVGGAYRREDDESHAPSAERTMSARYAGRCALTGEAIAVGDTIRFQRGTKGPILVAKYTGAPRTETVTVSDEIVIGGKAYYRNRRGRCEDAPCCGCCTI